MLDVGGIPQGDYAPVPLVLSLARLGGLARDDRARRALRARRRGRDLGARRRRAAAAAPLLPADPGRAAARVPARLRRAAGAAARVGLRPLEEPRRLRAPARRRGRPRRLPRARIAARRDRDRLAVGDAVQHLGVQPAPVPGRARAGRAHARRRRAHGRLGHAVGEPRLDRRPEAARPGVRAPAPRAGAELRSRGREHFVRGPDGEPWVARWWMGTGSPVDFTSAAAEAWWRAAGARACSTLGVEGIKADDGEGYYFPDEVTLRRRPHAAPRPAGRRGCSTAARCSARSTSRTPGEGVLFGRPGWTGQQAVGDDLGRRPGVGLLVAARARRRHAHRRRLGLLELVARRRRLPRRAARRAAARRSC